MTRTAGSPAWRPSSRHRARHQRRTPRRCGASPARAARSTGGCSGSRCRPPAAAYDDVLLEAAAGQMQRDVAAAACRRRLARSRLEAWLRAGRGAVRHLLGEATSARGCRALRARPFFAFVPMGTPVPMTAGPDPPAAVSRPVRPLRPYLSPAPVPRPGRPNVRTATRLPDPRPPPDPDPPPSRPRPSRQRGRGTVPDRGRAAARSLQPDPRHRGAAPCSTARSSDRLRRGAGAHGTRRVLRRARPRGLHDPGPARRRRAPRSTRSDCRRRSRSRWSSRWSRLRRSLVLPGLDLVPPNTVVPLETNTASCEAYLVGLNTEMGRELLWRGYPADLSATYFDRFWDASARRAASRHRRRSSPGATARSAQARADEDFVMLVRSELLRRYPGRHHLRDAGPGEERYPIFTGGFAPTCATSASTSTSHEIGDWSIVIQEHPSAPRFGVEVGTDTGTPTHVAPPKTEAALDRAAGRGRCRCGSRCRRACWGLS